MPDTRGSSDRTRSACHAGLKTRAEVEKGVKNIIADLIAKDKSVLDELRNR